MCQESLNDDTKPGQPVEVAGTKWSTFKNQGNSKEDFWYHCSPNHPCSFG